MKIVLTILSLIMVTACQKEELPTYADMVIYQSGSQAFGVATASLNGNPWEAGVYPELNLLDSGYVRLNFYTETEEGWLRDVVTTGHYSIHAITPTTVSVSDSLWSLSNLLGLYDQYLDGGDIPGGSARIDEDRQPSSITYQYRASTNTLSGTFDLYFRFPDGEIFDLEDGEFSVVLEN